MILRHALIALYVIQIGCFIFSTKCLAQHTVSTTNRIGEVTVFFNRAEINSSVTANLVPGENVITVKGLSKNLFQQSIQVKGKGDFVILGVKHQLNYLNKKEINQRSAIYKDSLEEAIDQKENAMDKRDAFEKEKGMLLQNQSVKGTEEGLIVEEFRLVVEFFRARLLEINKAIRNYSREIERWDEEISRLQQTINQISNSSGQSTSEIIISVQSNKAQKAELNLSYLVNDASWSPIYDLRASDTSSVLSLQYKANVIQQTGRDWENIKVNLSTASPNLSGQAPDISPNYVSFLQTPAPSSAKRSNAVSLEYDYEEVAGNEGSMMEEAESVSMADFTTEVNTGLAVVFGASIRYSIASSTVPKLVDIKSTEVEAEFEHFTIPKRDPSVFLIANIKNWQAYNLLPGKVNVFYGGTLVGNTYINPDATSDELSISLGRDPQVVVRREAIKDYSERNFFGNKKTESFGYEITIRNNKPDKITVKVKDQIPVSTDEQIEVNPIDLSNGDLDLQRGIISWTRAIGSGKSEKIRLKYQISYPKDRQIQY